jgi:hypothetical protein
MRIALGLIHNKAGNGNRQQINALLPFVERHVVDTNGVEFDPDVVDDVEILRIYYTIAGLAVQHEVIFFQVLPFGVNPPNNLYSLNSRKVLYGQGDNDKTGTHPRFWNWGLHRAFNNDEADVAGLITDISQFTVAGLQFQLNRLIDRRVLVVPLWGVLASSRLMEIVAARQPGQRVGETLLREDMPFGSALDDMRARIVARGLEHE